MTASSHDAVQRPRMSRTCLPRHFIVPNLRLDFPDLPQLQSDPSLIRDTRGVV
jgi:hypothetical protein